MVVIKWIFIILFISIVQTLIKKGLYTYLEDFESEKEDARIDADGKLLEQEPKTGYWIEENINEWSCKVFCSECGCPPPFEHVSNGDVYSASGYGVINKTKFCPNCGAKMVELQKSEG